MKKGNFFRRKRIFFTSALIAAIILAGFLFYFSQNISLEKPKVATLEESYCAPFNAKIDPSDGKLIEELITTLAHTSTLGLAFKKGHLEAIGQTLDEHVPPLEFLGYIFSHQELANDMVLIRESNMKYGNFIKGLQKNMLKEDAAGCLDKKVKGFSKYLDLDEKMIHALIQSCLQKAKKSHDNKAFSLLVDYLIQQKAKVKGK